MANTLQIKRGAEANIPTLATGEPAFSTDTYRAFIGDGTTNRGLLTYNEFATQSIVAAVTASTPASVTINEGNLVGRVIGGNVGALPGSDVMSILDGTASAAFSMNSQKITNLADGTSAQDAVTKSQVDIAKAGLDAKDSVTAATDGTNIDLTATSDPNPIDGVTLTDNDRILLKDQSTSSENGIYVTATATDPSTWYRAPDANEDSKVTSGLFTFVTKGTVNENAGFVLTTNDPITLGSTSLNFTQFSGAGEITAGTGINKSGDTLNHEAASVHEVGGSLEITHNNLNITSNDHHYKTTDNEVYGLVLVNTAANRPTAGTSGQWFIASDTLKISYDDGASWNTVLEEESKRIRTTEIDDSPIDGVTNRPISSNWAYQHNNSSSGVHGAGTGNLLNSNSTIDCGTV